MALLGWACTLCTKAQLTVALFFSFKSFLFSFNSSPLRFLLH